MANVNGAKKFETRIKVGPVLGSYANIFTPRAVTDKQEPKYSISLLFSKNANPNSPEGKSLAQLKDLIHRLAVLKFGPDYMAILKFGIPLRDGDIEKPDKPEYVGKLFLNASSKRPIGIVDRHLKPVTSESEAYSGCLYVASLNAFSYKDKPGTGISFGLNNLLVFEKGTRIDGRKEAAEDFAEYAGDDETPSRAAENPLD
jgi:hypothetical protein